MRGKINPKSEAAIKLLDKDLFQKIPDTIDELRDTAEKIEDGIAEIEEKLKILDEKLAKAMKKLENFDILKKIQMQYEMEIITREEYEEKVKNILQ